MAYIEKLFTVLNVVLWLLSNVVTSDSPRYYTVSICIPLEPASITTMSSSETASAPAEGRSGSSVKDSMLGKAFSKVDLDGHDLPPSPAPSSPRNGRKYALATELVYTESSDQYNASSVPIYQVMRSHQSGGHYKYNGQGDRVKLTAEIANGISF